MEGSSDSRRSRSQTLSIFGLGLAPAHHRCRRLDGVDDALVARAPAEHRGDTLADLGLRRLGLHAQEIERGHQHARRAEAALEPVVLVEGLLQRVKLAVLHQAFDRPELGALGLDREHDAGARGLAIEQDGARAADPVLTAHVRAGEPEVFTEEIDEELPRLAAPLVLDAVDFQADDHGLTHLATLVSARLTARPVSTPVR